MLASRRSWEKSSPQRTSVPGPGPCSRPSSSRDRCHRGPPAGREKCARGGRRGCTEARQHQGYRPRVIDHYLEGSVIAYYGELIEEIIAQQEGLPEGEEALLELLTK